MLSMSYIIPRTFPITLARIIRGTGTLNVSYIDRKLYLQVADPSALFPLFNLPPHERDLYSESFFESVRSMLTYGSFPGGCLIGRLSSFSSRPISFQRACTELINAPLKSRNSQAQKNTWTSVISRTFGNLKILISGVIPCIDGMLVATFGFFWYPLLLR